MQVEPVIHFEEINMIVLHHLHELLIKQNKNSINMKKQLNKYTPNSTILFIVKPVGGYLA